MSRFFTVFEADRLLPTLSRLVELLVCLQRTKSHAERSLDEISQKIMFSGGMVLPRERLFEWKAVREQTQKDLQGTLEQIHSLGCEVKDLEEGLVDFPSLYQGEKVYLCWRLGEDSVRYWHTVSAGFEGRQPIDEHFIAFHSGDAMQ
jgi:hypothetical protein